MCHWNKGSYWERVGRDGKRKMWEMVWDGDMARMEVRRGKLGPGSALKWGVIGSFPISERLLFLSSVLSMTLEDVVALWSESGRLSGTGACWNLRISHLFFQDLRSFLSAHQYMELCGIRYGSFGGGGDSRLSRVREKAAVCPMIWDVFVCKVSSWQSLEVKRSLQGHLKFLCLPWPQCASVGRES